MFFTDKELKWRLVTVSTCIFIGWRSPHTTTSIVNLLQFGQELQFDRGALLDGLTRRRPFRLKAYFGFAHRFRGKRPPYCLRFPSFMDVNKHVHVKLYIFGSLCSSNIALFRPEIPSHCRDETNCMSTSFLLRGSGIYIYIFIYIDLFV